MKYLLLFLTLLLGCKSKNPSNSFKEIVVKELCPEDGKCFHDILKNKKIEFNYNNLNELYPTFPEGENIIFKFEYKRNEISNTQDSSYREEILIELNPHDLEFETATFKGKKILFARWCYCKGQTGYYKIEQGKLSVIKKATHTYELKLNFKMDEVPQVITEIKHIFTLE
jgi:hypothetical protein